jgi:hypothetical protein
VVFSRPRRSLVTEANERVSIVQVCSWVGVALPTIPEGKSVKVRCPFGAVYHIDQGIEPNFRVYPSSNSAYCFRCSTSFTPVKLASMAWDLGPSEAAQALLDRVGYRPLSMAQEWKSVVTAQPEVDRSSLAQALKVYASRICEDWSDRQFEPVVSAKLDQCLALLDKVVTEEDVKSWLSTCKLVMHRVLVQR